MKAEKAASAETRAKKAAKKSRRKERDAAAAATLNACAASPSGAPQLQVSPTDSHSVDKAHGATAKAQHVVHLHYCTGNQGHCSFSHAEISCCCGSASWRGNDTEDPRAEGGRQHEALLKACKGSQGWGLAVL